MKPSELLFTPWKKTFAWWPVKTINHETVWLRTIYKRTEREIFELPVLAFSRMPEKQYATAVDIAEQKLQGKQ